MLQTIQPIYIDRAHNSRAINHYSLLCKKTKEKKIMQTIQPMPIDRVAYKLKHK